MLDPSLKKLLSDLKAGNPILKEINPDSSQWMIQLAVDPFIYLTGSAGDSIVLHITLFTARMPDQALLIQFAAGLQTRFEVGNVGLGPSAAALNKVSVEYIVSFSTDLLTPSAKQAAFLSLVSKDITKIQQYESEVTSLFRETSRSPSSFDVESFRKTLENLTKSPDSDSTNEDNSPA